MLVLRLVLVPYTSTVKHVNRTVWSTWKVNRSICRPHNLISMLADESRKVTILRLLVGVSRTLVVWKDIESFVTFLFLHFFLNKSPTWLNGQHSIRDCTLTFCQKGSYLHINSSIIEQTRGQWNTTLTWENFSIAWIHMNITYWLREETQYLLFLIWELNDSSLKQHWIPFSQGCTVACLFEIGPVVLEKRLF